MHFEGGESGFSCSFKVPIASALASCRAVISADLSLRYISSHPLSNPFAILCLNSFFSSGMFLRDQMTHFELF